MTTRHLSLRVDQDTLDRLDAEGRRRQQTRSQVAKTLLEEGLRMERHPGITFKPGPTGRRAAVFEGPDVWEVMNAFQGTQINDRVIKVVASNSGLRIDQIHTVLRYYADYPEEIDERIRLNNEEYERSSAAWRSEQRRPLAG